MGGAWQAESPRAYNYLKMAKAFTLATVKLDGPFNRRTGTGRAVDPASGSRAPKASGGLDGPRGFGENIFLVFVSFHIRSIPSSYIFK